jgi:NADPH:quinone reductase-like Zn-dependent oxidoreductase
VLALLDSGAITAKVAARMPLSQAVEAMRMAESHTAYGKIVLIP